MSNAWRMASGQVVSWMHSFSKYVLSALREEGTVCCLPMSIVCVEMCVGAGVLASVSKSGKVQPARAARPCHKDPLSLPGALAGEGAGWFLTVLRRLSQVESF